MPQEPASHPSQPDSTMPNTATRFFDSSASATLERSAITSQTATNGGWILNLTQASSSSEGLPQPLSNATEQGTMPEESCAHHDHPESSNKTRAQVYFDCLLCERRGSPIYIPSPDRNLPKEYRRNGVRPGDVVVINNDGGVSYFFNIFSSADDPINRGRVPPSFRPFPKHLAREETYPYCTDVVMSSSIRSSGSSLGFETSREGALVVMPSGANLTRLANTKRFDKYIERHLESWYHFVLSDGLPIENGDIRLVVGCDKTTNWGMATFLSQERIGGQVVFQRPVSEPYLDCARYTSQCSGSAAAQTGPKAAELDDLREEGSNAPIENQCLFLRTLNPQLSEALFEEIAERVETECFDDWDTGLEPEARGFLTSTSPTVHQLDPNRVLPGYTTKASMNHPSSDINRLLLNKFPNAKLVITGDDDWAGVITKDERFPCAHEVVKRMERTYTLLEQNGVVTLASFDEVLEGPLNKKPSTRHRRHTDETTFIPKIPELFGDNHLNMDLFTSGTTISPPSCFTMSEPETFARNVARPDPYSRSSQTLSDTSPPHMYTSSFLDFTDNTSNLNPFPWSSEEQSPYCDSSSLFRDTNKTQDVSELLLSVYRRIEDVKIHQMS
ncbi:hypothetical protein CPB83DRAFT_168396 [Crepidotus variabilis]|uniref:Uncharacterized protein n=1 Tax=Crepidotus variabilis TaxID=179855 RepID=A0A9P6EKL4_9AGAR|nr:hypothetical protein CPB83DRAFT_168396 [Crepidotus variabilis]